MGASYPQIAGASPLSELRRVEGLAERLAVALALAHQLLHARRAFAGADLGRRLGEAEVDGVALDREALGAQGLVVEREEEAVERLLVHHRDAEQGDLPPDAGARLVDL